MISYVFTKTCVMSKYETLPDLEIVTFKDVNLYISIRSISNFLKCCYQIKTFDISHYIEGFYFKNIFTLDCIIESIFHYIETTILKDCYEIYGTQISRQYDFYK